MLILLGILLLVAGASVTFAVDRQLDGVDVQLAGWILLGGGALAMILAMIRAAAIGSTVGSTVGSPVRAAPAGPRPPHAVVHAGRPAAGHPGRDAPVALDHADAEGRRAA